MKNTLNTLNTHRKTSLTAGILYLLTFVSIPTLSLYAHVKSANYVVGSGPDTAAIVGALLEIVMALACIGTAVVLYPVLKRQSETLALGLVASRVLEASAIFMGVACLLTIVSLRQAGAGSEMLPVSHALTAAYDRIFLLSQSFLPAINDLLLGYLLFKSRLVPRAISIIGIVGALPLVVAYVAIMFGLIEQHGSIAGASALLVAIFELVLGVWLVAKGFNRKAVELLEERN